MYAVITGAGRGIGAAIAQRLARDGYDIALNYRSDHAAAGIVAADIRALGRQCWTIPFDVVHRDQAQAALAPLVESHGAPWAVVVNAGVARDGLLMWMEPAQWHEPIATALDGFYNVLRPLLAAMLMARQGRIVSIASVSGEMGNAGQVNYSAAKGGVIAATKALAREVAKRALTANVVSPGLIETAMTSELPLERMLANVPLGRLGHAREVAAAVGFLCSADAGYVTGQVIGVNGGLHT